MTPEFEKTVNRLARARNFEDGAYLLITAHQDETSAHIERKGISDGILNGLTAILEMYLEQMNDEAASMFREDIKAAVIEDEQRRFQNKGIEETTEEK